MPGAGTTVGSADTLRNPPSGARVTGQVALTQGTYLYIAVGQQALGIDYAPGKHNASHCNVCRLKEVQEQVKELYQGLPRLKMLLRVILLGFQSLSLQSSHVLLLKILDGVACTCMTHTFTIDSKRQLDAAGGSGGSFIYSSTSAIGVTDASGNPTLLLVAAGHCSYSASPATPSNGSPPALQHIQRRGTLG